MSHDVRHATVGDARPIAQVHVRSWIAAYRGLLPDERIDYFTEDRREAGWIDLLAEPGDNAQRTFVACAADATIVGFSALSVPCRDDDADPLTGEIAALYVDPPRWRRGAGHELMERSLDELRDLGCTTAIVWVLAANSPARAFYRACGLGPDGTERVEDGVLHVRLRRRFA